MILSNPWIAALSALFVWWFSTGVLLYAVKRADAGAAGPHLALTGLALPLLGVGAWGIVWSLTVAGPEGAYVGFLSALAVWGWIELAFLAGVITGPNRRMRSDHAQGRERFLQAWGTIAWHEILLVSSLLAIAALSWDAVNQTALWTFGVLFLARVSAKLNLFFGVPHINTGFLPRPLAHLPSHFRHRPINALFPVSVTLLSLATFCWLERLFVTGQTEFALLAALTALALLEHWFMVLPLPDEKLWRWMMPAPKTTQKTLMREEPHGF